MVTYNKIESILKKLENIYRGTRLTKEDDKNLLRQSYENFFWYIEKSTSYIRDTLTSHLLENMSENEKKENLGKAIKLHNKVRNLSTSLYFEMKNVLQAVAACMIAIYGENSAKAVHISVKLLSKVGI